MEIKLKKKYTIYLPQGAFISKGSRKNMAKGQCRVCKGAKRRSGIHPGCRANRKDTLVRVLPRGGPGGGRYRI